MDWRRASESLKSAFAEALPDDPRVERKQMFGYPCAFVNGNMFAGVHQEILYLRLGEQERATLLDQPGSGPFEPMPGRAMREYVAAPTSLVADPDHLRDWMARAFHYGASLPPKSGSGSATKKPRASRTASKR
jgi:TfoX/Sxy family transcriptional regulator of competence genes